MTEKKIPFSEAIRRLRKEYGVTIILPTPAQKEAWAKTGRLLYMDSMRIKKAVNDFEEACKVMRGRFTRLSDWKAICELPDGTEIGIRGFRGYVYLTIRGENTNEYKLKAHGLESKVEGTTFKLTNTDDEKIELSYKEGKLKILANINMQ